MIPFFLVQFTRHFFKTFIQYPLWDKFLLTLAVLNGIVFLTFQLIDPSWGLTESKGPITPSMVFTNDVAVSLLNFFIAITFLKYRKKKNKFINLVIIGGLPLMLFWGIEIFLEGFDTLGIIKDPFSESIYLITEIVCIIWFVLFFSLVLLKRFNQLRIENAQQALDKHFLPKKLNAVN